MIHGPSIVLGSGITALAVLISFFMFDIFNNQPELEIKPVPLQEDMVSSITMSTFMENGSPILGNLKAPITIVEFGDYQCFFCNKFFHTTRDNILKNYVENGKVKFLFKDYTIIGPDSVSAAHAAHCANDQDQFWQYHDNLYNNWTGENNGWASPDNLLQFAETIGLNKEKFSNCMESSNHTELIARSNQDAKALGLQGTPAFFIIGPNNHVTKIDGAQPIEVFDKIFSSELEKK